MKYFAELKHETEIKNISDEIISLKEELTSLKNELRRKRKNNKFLYFYCFLMKLRDILILKEKESPISTGVIQHIYYEEEKGFTFYCRFFIEFVDIKNIKNFSYFEDISLVYIILKDGTKYTIKKMNDYEMRQYGETR